MRHTAQTIPATQREWRNLMRRCERAAGKAVQFDGGSLSAYNHKWIDAYLDKANELLGGYGVEAITGENAWISGYYCNIRLLYVNMGDTYDTTICYDTEKDKLFYGDWGTWMEQNDVEETD